MKRGRRKAPQNKKCFVVKGSSGVGRLHRAVWIGLLDTSHGICEVDDMGSSRAAVCSLN